MFESEAHTHQPPQESTDIGDLISAAMEDSSPASVAKSKKRVSQEPRPLKTKIKVSGESLLMDFDSDSDDEPKRAKVPASAGGRKVAEQGSIFSESDDEDFCIVHTPTSTRVVSS